VLDRTGTQVLWYEYGNAIGLVTAVVDAEGRRVEYEEDTDGLATSVPDSGSSTSGNASSTASTTDAVTGTIDEPLYIALVTASTLGRIGTVG